MKISKPKFIFEKAVVVKFYENTQSDLKNLYIEYLNVGYTYAYLNGRDYQKLPYIVLSLIILVMIINTFLV